MENVTSLWLEAGLGLQLGFDEQQQQMIIVTGASQIPQPLDGVRVSGDRLLVRVGSAVLWTRLLMLSCTSSVPLLTSPLSSQVMTSGTATTAGSAATTLSATTAGAETAAGSGRTGTGSAGTATRTRAASISPHDGKNLA